MITPEIGRTRAACPPIEPVRLGPSGSVVSVLKPAGLENAKGILSTNYLKDPTDPTWKEDPAIKG